MAFFFLTNLKSHLALLTFTFLTLTLEATDSESRSMFKKHRVSVARRRGVDKDPDLDLARCVVEAVAAWCVDSRLPEADPDG